MAGKVVYLMRGLPSCGKSHTARCLAGAHGVIVETDDYFRGVTDGSGETTRSKGQLLRAARDWSFRRFEQAVVARAAPIVVDRGNGLTLETYRYVRLAREYDYEVEFAEPDSEWWQEIRVLLKYKEVTSSILDTWAERLAELNAATHGVEVAEIRQLMDAWQPGLTISHVLAFGQQAEAQRPDAD